MPFLRFRKCIRWSRRLFSAPLKMRRVPEEAVFGTEYLFRTVEACFEHRVPLKTRRVPEEAFLSTARIFGTVGGRFRYRVPSKEQGKGPPQRSLAHRGKLPPQRSRLPCLRRDNQVINLIEVRSFRRASENASHLVVRSTGKRVAVASEKPVYPQTEQGKGPPELPIDFFAIFA